MSDLCNVMHYIGLNKIQLNTEPYNSIHFNYNVMFHIHREAVDLCVNVLSTDQRAHCDMYLAQ